MAALDHILDPMIPLAEIINGIYDSNFLANWGNHLESLIKGVNPTNNSNNDEVLIKTLVVLGKISCIDLDVEVILDKNEWCQIFAKQVKVLTISCRKEWLEMVISRLTHWSSSANGSFPNDQLGHVLSALRKFCQAVLQKLPYAGKYILPNFVGFIIRVIVATGEQTPFHQYPNLFQEFLSLQKRIEEVGKQFVDDKMVLNRGRFDEEYESLLQSLDPPEDFRKIPIVPTLQELLHENRPFLRPNKVKGPYKSPDHYFDCQFRLLREDFVQPLRNGVAHFLQNKEHYLKPRNGNKKLKIQRKENSVRIYTGITFKGILKESGDKCHILNLPEELVLKVNWEKSKKLLAGSLVMLTSDCCKTATFATVLARPFDKKFSNTKSKIKKESQRREQSKGILRLEVETGEEFLKEQKVYIMLECEAYFEAFRHNLNILQNSIKTSMSKFIVDVSSCSVELPLYIKRLILLETKEGVVRERRDCKLKLPIELTVCGPQTAIELRLEKELNSLPLAVSASNTSVWPASLIQSRMGLDDDQYNAYKTALTSELAIIQGPPGTGKTFIGLQIVRTLLLNKKDEGCRMPGGVVPQAPILIVCYTNHALDQFLELLVTEIRSLDLVRLGGQCKSDILSKHVLQEKRRSMKMRRSDEKDLFRRVKGLEWDIITVKREILELEKPCGVFNFQLLSFARRIHQRLPDSVRDALKGGTWLGVPIDGKNTEEAKLREMISKCFKAADITTHDSETEENEKLSPEKPEHEDGDDDDAYYYEDYDLDELLEHRLVSADDDPMSYNKETENENGLILYHEGRNYFSNCSSALCHDRAKSFYSMQLGQDRLTEPEMEELLRRAEILSALFDFHQKGLLQLPAADAMLLISEGTDSLTREKIEKYVFADQNKNIVDFNMSERWAIYFKVVQITLQLAKDVLREKEKMLEQCRKLLKIERQQMDGELLGQMDLIGMTTTGAAKNHELLKIAKPQIVVIEEAAEILEAHVVSALTSACNHLILIGDHLQLRPSVNVYQLEQTYHLNVSLFERMIINGFTLCTLKTQHRMRPDIADLIIGPIYEQLYNYENVLAYPLVKGVVKSLFFVTHSEREHNDAELLSKSNYHEAHFMTGLCEYLLLQGYASGKITILTTYTAQMFLLKKVISSACSGVRITCVDNYQGEENDIILLSLVRSNDEDQIGFVGIDNRICVALSRAKHGLYVIGNLDGLANKSMTWRQIKKKLQAGDNLGESLELVCVQHGNKTLVKERQDFGRLMLGGCGEMCDTALNCGHRCPLSCHGRDHDFHGCLKSCEKHCPLGHPCPAKCFESCPPCQTPVLKVLPCEHELTIPCHKDPDSFPCTQLVSKELKCGMKHVKELKCHVDVRNEICQVLVEKMLVPCGHIRPVKCHMSPIWTKCELEVDLVFKSCGHTNRVICYEQLGMVWSEKCAQKCGLSFDCGHGFVARTEN